MTAAFAAGTVGLGGLALWLGLLAVPAAAGAAFVCVSDALEGRPALLGAVTTSCALALVVLGDAVRSNATVGTTPRLAAWALLAALFSYSLPAVAWVLEPVKVTRRRPERRRRVYEDDEVLSRAA
ncbi:MAG TPA: hypothetical protein VFA37_07875 [Gaiellaceae bacterium]|nr:hypothetical protein [Gaiellaceae bacterium]